MVLNNLLLCINVVYHFIKIHNIKSTLFLWTSNNCPTRHKTQRLLSVYITLYVAGQVFHLLLLLKIKEDLVKFTQWIMRECECVCCIYDMVLNYYLSRQTRSHKVHLGWELYTHTDGRCRFCTLYLFSTSTSLFCDRGKSFVE